MFGLAAGARGVREDARRLGLADALAGVGLDGFGGRESGWLALGHGWNEYGMKKDRGQVSGVRDQVFGAEARFEVRSRDAEAETRNYTR